ncbi:MAG TPA: DUF4386 domain-containing protein [Thermoanaerobaculia bacterium]|nr:DUF4386 domain-containing protein [Thermoanaerobaculia bacterium]
MTEPTVERSPVRIVRMAGIFYALTFLTGGLALAGGRPAMVAGLLAGACYVAVTILFYFIFRPAGQGLSLLAAIVSLAGCAVGPLALLHLVPAGVNPLVFFGFYCLLIGYLVFTSTFFPRFLGVLMAIGGLSWLTFASTPLAAALAPFNYLPGVVGEGALTVWLLVKGVDVVRWRERASHVS